MHEAPPGRTAARGPALAYATALFVVTALGLGAVEWLAQDSGRGSKGGAPWIVPFALLVCLLPATAFAVTLRLAARPGLRLSPRAALALAALLGALTPSFLLAVKPLMGVMGGGGNLVGGLAVSQLGLCTLAIASAAVLASAAPRVRAP
jgi:hypothetical protein